MFGHEWMVGWGIFQNINLKLPSDFEDSGVPNSSSFRIGKYVIPGDPFIAPPLTPHKDHCDQIHHHRTGWPLVGNERIKLYMVVMEMKLPWFPTKGLPEKCQPRKTRKVHNLTMKFTKGDSYEQTLFEPRKTPSYFPLYWLVNRDPYNGLWNNPYITG